MEDEDPEATLLAPWSKRHYENVPTQRVPPAISTPPYIPENAALEGQQTFSQDNGQALVGARNDPKKSLQILRYSHPVPDTISAHTLAWSHDGTLLTACLAQVASDSTEAFPPDANQVLSWQAATGQVRQVISLPAPTNKAILQWKTPLAWSPVETHLLAFAHWTNAIIWDVQRNAPLLMLSTTDTQDPLCSR